MSKKPRGLGLLELAGVGLAAPLGLGLYVLAGHVAHAVAGPAAFLSVVFAAAVASLAGLSYLELAAHFPEARGPASLVFSRGGAGELLGTLVAWNLGLDYLVGAAAAARGARAALDELLGGVLHSTFLEVAPLDPGVASPFVDFLALALPLLAAAGLLAAPRGYVTPQVAVSLLTLCTAMFALVAGSLEGDAANWSLPGNSTQSTGQGGFLPFGFPRVLSGAAIFSFVFVGVDHVAVTGRKGGDSKVKGWSLVALVTGALCSTLSLTLVLTLMQPYFALDENAAFVTTFSGLGWSEARWIVCVVGVVALPCTVVCGVARAASLAEDWPGLCGVNKTVLTTSALALVTGMLGAFVEERQLASVLSVGTLLAFIAVQASLVLVKCRNEGSRGGSRGVYALTRQLVPGRGRKDTPSATSSAAAQVALVTFCVSAAVVCAVSVHAEHELLLGETWAVSLLTTGVLISLLALASLASQPRASSTFTAAAWPVLPCLGMLSALYLLISLRELAAWIRLAVCSALGLSAYVARRWASRHRELSSELLTNGTSTPPLSSTYVEPHASLAHVEPGAEPRASLTSVTSQCEVTPPTELFSEEIAPQWSKLWENSKEGSFEPDFDEEVAEVHEVSCVEPEQGTPALAMKRSSKQVVVVLPGSSCETSDTDSQQNTSTSPEGSPCPSPPASPKPPPLPVLLNEPRSLTSPEGSPCPSPPASPKPPPLPILLNETRCLTSPEGSPCPSPPPSPKPPPLPVLLDKPRDVSSRPEPMLSLQEELKTTLRLRNQRKIDEIENTVVNVSEGIEMFGGGRRSRTTSLTADVSVKAAMKAGKFEDAAFVSKLNSILRGQVNEPRPVVKRPAPLPRPVVLVSSEHKQKMKTTLEQLSKRRDVAPKSLEALNPTSQVQIVSSDSLLKL